MKTVYFVRHGESEVNVRDIPYGIDEPLTELGRKQSHDIAKRIAKLPIEAIISSTTARTRETAQFIAEDTGKAVEYSDDLVERRGPSDILGLAIDEPAVRETTNEWNDSFFRTDTRLRDAENFSDIRERSVRALEMLEARSESHIAVVTHGFFMRMIMALIVMGDELTPTEFTRFVTGYRTNNTGITVVESARPDMWRPWAYDGQRWIVRVWNDQAHLG